MKSSARAAETPEAAILRGGSILTVIVCKGRAAPLRAPQQSVSLQERTCLTGTSPARPAPWRRSTYGYALTDAKSLRRQKRHLTSSKAPALLYRQRRRQPPLQQEVSRIGPCAYNGYGEVRDTVAIRIALNQEHDGSCFDNLKLPWLGRQWSSGEEKHRSEAIIFYGAGSGFGVLFHVGIGVGRFVGSA